jgi:hypothetical protein
VVSVPVTQIPAPSQTIFVSPGQSISENLSFTAYSVIIQNNTVWYWYLDDARAFIPPGTTHFVSPLPGVSVANITFESPLGLPQPPIPTDGSGGQLVAQFLNEQNAASPGYVGYQPMGRNRMVFPFVQTNINPPLSLVLPIPASDGITINYLPAFGFNAIQIQVYLPSDSSAIHFMEQFYSAQNVQAFNNPHTIRFPESFPAGTTIAISDTGSDLSHPGKWWITI